VLPGCLSCHASFLKVVAGTQNRFASPPFGEGGVACERCHGPGDARVADPRALWQDAPSKNSGLVLVGTNLAMAQWRTGDAHAAEATLRKIIGLSPGFAPARQLLKRINGPPQ